MNSKAAKAIRKIAGGNEKVISDIKQSWKIFSPKDKYAIRNSAAQIRQGN